MKFNTGQIWNWDTVHGLPNVKFMLFSALETKDIYKQLVN